MSTTDCIELTTVFDRRPSHASLPAALAEARLVAGAAWRAAAEAEDHYLEMEEIALNLQAKADREYHLWMQELAKHAAIISE